MTFVDLGVLGRAQKSLLGERDSTKVLLTEINICILLAMAQTQLYFLHMRSGRLSGGSNSPLLRVTISAEDAFEVVQSWVWSFKKDASGIWQPGVFDRYLV